jgi:hypothetical protein
LKLFFGFYFFECTFEGPSLELFFAPFFKGTIGDLSQIFFFSLEGMLGDFVL